jgi:hypothetical protein
MKTNLAYILPWGTFYFYPGGLYVFDIRQLIFTRHNQQANYRQAQANKYNDPS